MIQRWKPEELHRSIEILESSSSSIDFEVVREKLEASIGAVGNGNEMI